MKTILRYLQPFYRRMGLGLGIKITATLAELALPYILSHILKNVIVTQSISMILRWGLLMILFSGLACVLNITANRMAARVSRNFSETVRRELFTRTLSLSAAQTDRFTIPSLESRITTDTYNIHNFVNMMQRMGVRAPILLIGGIAITLIMDSSLALVMIAILPVLFVSIYFISKRGVPMYTKVQHSVDNMIRVVREDAQGIRVIKALSKTEYEHRRYNKVNLALSADEQRAGIIMGASNPIMNLCMNLGITAVVALAAVRVAGLKSDPETVIAFTQYFTLISMAMMSVTRVFVMYSKSAASARRIAEVIDTPEDLLIRSDAECPPMDTDKHIVFEGVSFSYLGKKENVSGLSFELPKGSSLGVIGATGSGKSTLVKLLLRFYDPDAGRIFIHGRDIRTIPRAELAEMVGVVQQHDFLYADTVEENILFGRELSHEQVEWAARIAQAEDFITAFPEGYEHMLTANGTNISGGQKQRVLLARAIAAKPEILILDDSSSALDYKTDANLRRALREHMSESTTVMVAQRVSSIKDCDLILVLDEGRIIGAGDHEQLMASCPEYREISDSQMGGAFVE